MIDDQAMTLVKLVLKIGSQSPWTRREAEDHHRALGEFQGAGVKKEGFAETQVTGVQALVTTFESLDENVAQAKKILQHSYA